MLKKEISNSDKLGNVKTDRARVLYFMMLPHLDVKGRLEANVKLIKGQITTMLPYSPRAIQSCLEQLHDSGLIILYDDSGKQYLEYTRFEDFQKLNPGREAESTTPPPTPDNSRPNPDNSPLSKDKISISKVKYNQDSKELGLASLLFELMLKNKHDHSKPNLQTWAEHIDKMIRLNGRDPKVIESVIRWCQQDLFWQKNILSTQNLRKHFDRLELNSNGKRQQISKQDWGNELIDSTK